jgi:adenosylmethionine-8-amino-7-oxononanoate aminotransferase
MPLVKIWRPYTQEMTATPPLAVRSASGAHLHLESGQAVFDGISSWWLVTHGHCHSRIQEAIRKQLESIHQVVFANFTYSAAEEFTALLGGFLPKDLSRAFFSDNGSTAVEVAMKMAYQYSKQSGNPQRQKFLNFEHSYHGDTSGAMSVSQRGLFTKNYQGLLFETIRCQQGHGPSDPFEAWTSDFMSKLEEFENQICAVILEPLIQGAGGMIFWPVEALQQICTLARKKGIPVIFDEVMTGFGRTGSMFAFEQVGVVPDFLCLSKGLTGGFLPMGLTVTRTEIFEAFSSERSDKMLFHGHSYTGNSLSCAAALANLHVWQEESPLDKLRAISEAHSRALTRLSQRLPLRNVRVCGTVAAFEIPSPEQYAGKTSQKIFASCLEQGVFLRPLGPTVYLMPPYCSKLEDLEQAWEILGAAIL